MAKIDTSLIEGFAEMSAEDQIKALTEYSLPDPDYSGYVKKDVLDKTASELAELKRRNKAKLTDDEQKKQEQAELLATMQTELEQLRKDKLLATTKSSYLGLGYSEEMATEISRYVIDGETDKVFATQAKFLAEYKKNIEKTLTNNVPPPENGASTKGMTLEEFRKMPQEARIKFYNENQEMYKKLYTEGD